MLVQCNKSSERHGHRALRARRKTPNQVDRIDARDGSGGDRK